MINPQLQCNIGQCDWQPFRVRMYLIRGFALTGAFFQTFDRIPQDQIADELLATANFCQAMPTAVLARPNERPEMN